MSQSIFRRLTWTVVAFLVPSIVGAAEHERSGDPLVAETLPDGMRPRLLEVSPEKVSLHGGNAYRQVLVTAVLEGGERIDATRMVEIDGSLDLVSVSRRGIVRPKADGEGMVTFRLNALEASLPVVVRECETTDTASFVQDVMPTLSKLGCNAGTCHGSAQGKNGFKLSLRGYDPVEDHRALTDDHAGRRFNKAVPDRSLFLLKLSGVVPHVGGVLARPGDRYYAILRRWVADGALIEQDAPRVERIEIEPKNLVLPLPGMTQQFAVVATYSDGATRDVTLEAFVETSNTEVSSVDKLGMLKALRRGETAVLVRYEGRYAATPVIVMGDRSGFVWQEYPTYNFVDTHVYRKLQHIKALPSELCTDAEFLRRIYLDLTGLPPTAKETRLFLLDARDARVKREELVDRLIGSAEFVEFWTNKWSDLLQVNRDFLGADGARQLRDWIRGAVASNMRYDEFVHRVVTASGSTLKNPPASYYKILREPEEVMENTTQLFLGVRFNCNKCHDHPFERWTQDNYWELASFFANVERTDAPGSPKMPQRTATQTERPAFEEIISDGTGGELEAPNGQKVFAAFPYTHGTAVPDVGTRRERFASWLTAETNPYFARSFVNRIWSYFFGKGLIDPVDDIRAGNPPSNPELLEELTKEFIASGFDARALMRRIVRSRTYQHSVATNEWNDDDDTNFSHAYARRLSAEVLYDAVHRATGTTTRLPEVPPGSRAVELLDSNVKLTDGFLDLFGRPARESSCECERTGGVSLGHSLSLVNGPTIAEAIRDPENGVSTLVQYEKDPSRIVEELYLSILGRFPSDDERQTLAPSIDPLRMDNLAALSAENLQRVQDESNRWESAQNVPRWEILQPRVLRSRQGATFELGEDGSVLVSGEAPDTDTYTVVAATDLARITGIRLEVLPDESLPANGPGRADNGNFVLSEMSVAVVPATDARGTVVAELQNATQTFAQSELTAAAVIDGRADDKKGWAIADRFGQAQQAVFELKEDVGREGGAILTFTLDQQFGGKHLIGRFRVAVTSSPRPVRVLELPDSVAETILTPREDRSEAQRAALFRYFAERTPAVADGIRLAAAQDLAWALINSSAFLFNR